LTERAFLDPLRPEIPMATFKRRRLFVDRETQGALLLRVAFYWAFWLVSNTIVLVVFDTLARLAPVDGAPREGVCLWPAVLAGLLILPIVLYDVVAMTNRLIGPLVRMRRGMQSLAAGEHVEPIVFRKDDFWQSCADDFNAVAARIDHLERELERATAQSLVESVG
jgi:hypothetical protein